MQKLWGLLCVLMLGTIFVPSLKANAWNERTIFTFSQPVEIPNQVLPAGTYTFTLADSISDRDIVQIWQGKNRSKLLATILAIPDERMKPTSKPVITFEERTAGSPQAVQAWFYPGRVVGEQFVYPKAKAMEIAERTNTPVLSMPENTKSTMAELKKAPVKAEKPSGEEEEMAEVVTPATPAELAPPAPAATPKSLPKTASELPLVALLGLVSLCCAGAVGIVRKRIA